MPAVLLAGSPGSADVPAAPRVARPTPALLGAAVLVLATAAVLTALQGDARALASNLAELGLAYVGALGCLRGARRSTGSTRRGWTALALACASWGTGQLTWTFYEQVLGVPAPYPSPADVGYLLFPVAALVGLVLLAPPSAGLATPRRVLDALMVGCALGLLMWVVVLAPITAVHESGLGLAVSLAYPMADVVLLTVAALTVAQTRQARGPTQGPAPGRRPETQLWTLLGLAVLAMTLSDGAFAYWVASGTYVTGSPAEWGWWTAFVLMGTAGLTVTRRPVTHVDLNPPQPSVRAGLLTYMPIGAAAVITGVAALRGTAVGGIGLTLIVVSVLLVLLRQYVTVRENQTLLTTVAQREVELNRLAFHDALTGLANRALFLDRLRHALDLARREEREVAVAFLDLDGFKAVNDTLGHASGDALLVAVAGRLQSAVRASDTVARLGGDEFAVLVERGDPTVVAAGLLDTLQEPFGIGGRTAAVSASVGVAVADPGQGAEQAASLLHRADVAMYAVKSAGKSGVAVHSPSVAARSGKPDLARAFAAALDRGEIRAAYQPVVDPLDGRIGGVEALARWTHDGVDVPPATFLPICVRSGLSEQLTALMLEHSCTQLAAWNAGLGHRRLRMAVNVDPVEFTDTAMPDRIAALFDRHGLAPGQLVLEVTEVGLAHNQGTLLDVMGRLRAAGVRLALDDFGTGYSSLARLAITPLDTVKIDRMFVADIDHDLVQRRFLVGLLQLVRHLGLRSVAEGVERPGQLHELARLGCDLVQGHLIARPAPGSELTPLILTGTSVLPPHLLRVPF